MEHGSSNPKNADLNDAELEAAIEALWTPPKCGDDAELEAIVVSPPKPANVLAAEAEQLAWTKATGHRLDLIDRAAVDIPASLFDTSVSQFWLAENTIAYLIGVDVPRALIQKHGWRWNRHDKKTFEAIAPDDPPCPLRDIFFASTRRSAVTNSGWSPAAALPA